MRAKKTLSLLATALLLVASALAACQSSSPSRVEAPQVSAAAAATAAEGNAPANGGTSPLLNPGNPSGAGKKIIYTVEMTIEAKNTVQAIDSIASAAIALGGYLSDQQYYADDSQATSSVTVRIPPGNLKEFTAKVGAAGKVLSQTSSSQDVTDQYYDAQARLTNAQAQETQLLEIMKKATKISDILQVRQELNTVQQEIEQLKGQIRLVDNEVGFSTVKISVQQPAPPAVVADDGASGVPFWGFRAIGQKISRGFVDSFHWTLNAIGTVLMALSYIVIPLALVTAVVLVILLLVRLSLKKGRGEPRQKP